MDDSKMDDSSYKLGSQETRTVLGDLTNMPRKRGLSSVSQGPGVEFSKRLCLVVNDLVKEKSKASSGNDCNKSSQSCSNDENSSERFRVDDEVREPEKLSYDVLDACSQSEKLPLAPEDGNGSRDNVLVSTCSESGKKNCQGQKMPFSATQCDILGDGLMSGCLNDDKELQDQLDKRESKTTELPKSLNFRSLGLSRCSTISGNEQVNHTSGADLLKSCSCPFCLKAAYIWSDLHYQDIKGRLAVLKKSQKEANLLLQKSTRGRQTDSHGLASSHKSSNLEFDLMAQWRSLFMNTADILGHESSQLQSSFVAMKNLREIYKTNLESLAGHPQDKN